MFAKHPCLMLPACNFDTPRPETVQAPWDGPSVPGPSLPQQKHTDTLRVLPAAPHISTPMLAVLESLLNPSQELLWQRQVSSWEQRAQETASSSTDEAAGDRASSGCSRLCVGSTLLGGWKGCTRSAHAHACTAAAAAGAGDGGALLLMAPFAECWQQCSPHRQPGRQSASTC